MSQASTIFNANSNSAFYQALKSRKSASGQNGCKLLYFSESNECPACRTKVETFSTNSAQYSSKVIFEVPNFGHLSECFLKTKFGKVVNSSGTNACRLTENVGCHLWSTIKLVADGVEIARLTPEYLLAKNYKHSNDAKRRHFQQLIGGWKGHSGDTAYSTATNKDSVLAPEERAETDQVIYTPLQFWFSALEENMNRNISLGSLDRLFIEVEVNDKSYVNAYKSSSSVVGCPIETMSIVSYITELDFQEEAMWRASSLAIGETMTQIGRNIVQHVEPKITVESGDVTAGFLDKTIRLNMITGQVQKLYVIVSPIANDGVGSQQSHLEPMPLKGLELHANGVEIYGLKSLNENENLLEDWVNRDYDCVSEPGRLETGAVAVEDMGAGWSVAHGTIVSAQPSFVQVAVGDVTGAGSNGTDQTSAEYATSFNACLTKALAGVPTTTQDKKYTSSIDPKHIYCLNFKNVGSDQRGTSATGSINFTNLSAPEIKIKLNCEAGGVYGGIHCAAADYKCVVIAEQLTMVSYGVNNAGRVSLRMVS